MQPPCDNRVTITIVPETIRIPVDTDMVIRGTTGGGATSFFILVRALERWRSAISTSSQSNANERHEHGLRKYRNLSPYFEVILL